MEILFTDKIRDENGKDIEVGVKVVGRMARLFFVNSKGKRQFGEWLRPEVSTAMTTAIGGIIPGQILDTRAFTVTGSGQVGT